MSRACLHFDSREAFAKWAALRRGHERAKQPMTRGAPVATESQEQVRQKKAPNVGWVRAYSGKKLREVLDLSILAYLPSACQA